MQQKRNSYIESVLKQFQYYKAVAEKTFDQLTDEELNKSFSPETNTISIIVKHIVGNMDRNMGRIITGNIERNITLVTI